MQPSFEEVEKLAHALPEDQRIRLANSLYESVGEEEHASADEVKAAREPRSSDGSMRSIPAR